MRITHNARSWEPACIRSHAWFCLDDRQRPALCRSSNCYKRVLIARLPELFRSSPIQVLAAEAYPPKWIARGTAIFAFASLVLLVISTGRAQQGSRRERCERTLKKRSKAPAFDGLEVSNVFPIEEKRYRGYKMVRGVSDTQAIN